MRSNASSEATSEVTDDGKQLWVQIFSSQKYQATTMTQNCTTDGVWIPQNNNICFDSLWRFYFPGDDDYDENSDENTTLQKHVSRESSSQQFGLVDRWKIHWGRGGEDGGSWKLCNQIDGDVDFGWCQRWWVPVLIKPSCSWVLIIVGRRPDGKIRARWRIKYFFVATRTAYSN